jgi:hypothetical protein
MEVSSVVLLRTQEVLRGRWNDIVSIMSHRCIKSVKRRRMVVFLMSFLLFFSIQPLHVTFEDTASVPSKAMQGIIVGQTVYYPELADQPNLAKLEGKPAVPKVDIDDELGYCITGSNRDDPSHQSLYASVYVIVTVPTIWTAGSDITVRWDLWNDGDETAWGYLYFYGEDEGATEAYEVQSYSVRPFRSRTVYMQVAIDEGYTAGIKKAITRATQSGVPGNIYYKDHGYGFVQRFDPPSGLPADSMASVSGNPTYYYEGLADDGFNVPSAESLWHCKDWDIIWDAAWQVDQAPGNPTTPYLTGQGLVPQLHVLIDYPDEEDQDFLEACVTRWSDREIIERGYRGVCDEHAILLVSYLRAMGIPARYVWGAELGGGGHAWAELWDGSSWIHADATWNSYNNPQVYQGGGTYVDVIQVHAKWNDSLVHNEFYNESGTLYFFDGSDTNGVQGLGDLTYWATYDADSSYENYYGRPGWHDSCGSTTGWYRQTAGTFFQSYRTIQESGVLHTSSGYLYCDNIAADAGVWKHGPLFIKNLGFFFKLKELEYLKADMELVDSYGLMGDLVVILYDVNGNIVTVLNLYDSWWSSTSKAYLRYHDSTHQAWQWYEGAHYGTWRADWKIWREDCNIKGSVDVGGSLNQGTIYSSLTAADFDVKIAYIGIQFARVYSHTYYDQDLRLHDLELKFYFGAPA